MKTAMQELIEYTENLKSTCDFSFYKFFNKANELLEKEKAQIIKTYCDAEDKSDFFEYEHRYGRKHLTSEDYYNETFSQL